MRHTPDCDYHERRNACDCGLGLGFTPKPIPSEKCSNCRKREGEPRYHDVRFAGRLCVFCWRKVKGAAIVNATLKVGV